MALPPPATVSVVIPCWNAARTIGATVASARAQSVPPLEVLVVDDCSEDASAQVAAAAGARVIRLEAKGFAGGARNRGLDEARGEAIAFLDADATVAPDWLARALAVFAAQPDVGAVGGHIADGRGGRWGWLDHALFFAEWTAPDARACGGYPTIALVCRRDAIGDTRFRASTEGEDIFFGEALAARGWRIWYEPGIRIVHFHERLDFPRFWQRQRAAGRALFLTRRELDRPGKVLVRHPWLLWAYPRLWLLLRRLLRSDPPLRVLAYSPWLFLAETARNLGFLQARRAAREEAA
jgi:glycosyltransferase involved in cell wall biosynthesis